MTPEENKAFQNLFELFEHPGWKVFENEVAVVQNNFRYSMAELDDNNKFRETKGYINGLNYILSFPEIVRSQYEMKSTEDEDESI